MIRVSSGGLISPRQQQHKSVVKMEVKLTAKNVALVLVIFTTLMVLGEVWDVVHINDAKIWGTFIILAVAVPVVMWLRERK